MNSFKNMETESLHATFQSFKNTNVLIIGDVMIDQYLIGNVNRISPEAPIQILDHSESIQRLGGAANVALNIKALEATPLLLSIIGNDDSGKDFMSLMSNEHIDTSNILVHPKKRTTKKTRVMSGHQHLLRVDFEDKEDISDEFAITVLEKYQNILETKRPEVIIFQDYNKGLFTPFLIKEMTKMANDKNIPTAVDPKFNNFFEYKGITLFKPNLKELSEGLNIRINPTSGDLIKADQKLREKINHKISFFTLSEHGVFAASSSDTLLLPTRQRIISDVCGAGDAVISIVSLCLAKKKGLKMMIEMANTAGGQVCEIAGVSPLNVQNIKNEMLKSIN